jgi:phosphoribosylaminoimidazolecarboxamide formyltransferase / IMP cyclohydrolase
MIEWAIVRALISVSDKSNLEPLLELLEAKQCEIFSTGGTLEEIKKLGFKAKSIKTLTGVPEMMGGRVKTLDHKVFAGILAQESDKTEMSEFNLEYLDLVVVNLYPFQENPSIENIDIGGVSLLRAAAKNYERVCALCDPADYKRYIESPDSLSLRKELAIKVFKHCSNYDSAIYQNLAGLKDGMSINLEKKAQLRYGENPQQQASLCIDTAEEKFGFADFKQHQGKEISFNNLLDLNAAWQIVNEYEANIPCCAIIKHTNPCGVAIAPNASQAFVEALSCDTLSAFGGIVAFNVPVDIATANELTSMFLECVVAPGFTEDALKILEIKKNLRLIEMPWIQDDKKSIYRINGAYLTQNQNRELLNKELLKISTKKQIDETRWVDLILAWKIVKHVKSNAIVVVKDGKTVGIGCGQTNRVKAVEDALSSMDIDTRGAVLASDGFFPFADSIHLAAQNNIEVIIQPGGSIKDQEVIDACDELGIAMAFSGTRHFKH